MRKLGFTGSTRVGKLLYAGAANTVKKISLELGGNAPFMVFNDAYLDYAAAGVVGSAFRNAGQTCICANRVFVQARLAISVSAERMAVLASMLWRVPTCCMVGMGLRRPLCPRLGIMWAASN